MLTVQGNSVAHVTLTIMVTSKCASTDAEASTLSRSHQYHVSPVSSPQTLCTHQMLVSHHLLQPWLPPLNSLSLHLTMLGNLGSGITASAPWVNHLFSQHNTASLSLLLKTGRDSDTPLHADFTMPVLVTPQ